MKPSFVVPVGTQATHGSGNEQRRHIHPGNVRVMQGKKFSHLKMNEHASAMMEKNL